MRLKSVLLARGATPRSLWAKYRGVVALVVIGGLFVAACGEDAPSDVVSQASSSTVDAAAPTTTVAVSAAPVESSSTTQLTPAATSSTSPSVTSTSAVPPTPLSCLRVDDPPLGIDPALREVHATIQTMVGDLASIRTAIGTEDDFSSGWMTRGAVGGLSTRLAEDEIAIRAAAESLLLAEGGRFDTSNNLWLLDTETDVLAAVSGEIFTGTGMWANDFAPALAQRSSRASALEYFGGGGETTNGGPCGWGLTYVAGAQFIAQTAAPVVVLGSRIELTVGQRYRTRRLTNPVVSFAVPTNGWTGVNYACGTNQAARMTGLSLRYSQPNQSIQVGFIPDTTPDETLQRVPATWQQNGQEAVAVAGAPGWRLDIIGVIGDTDSPLPFRRGGHSATLENVGTGERAWIYLLDFGTETAIIIVKASEADFEAFAQQAQPVIDSIDLQSDPIPCD